MTNPWSATTFAKEGGLVMKLSNATLTNAQPGENAYLPRKTAIDQFDQLNIVPNSDLSGLRFFVCFICMII